MKHFFISYNSTDRTWAEWIAWQLEEAGYDLNVYIFRRTGGEIPHLRKET